MAVCESAVRLSRVFQCLDPCSRDLIFQLGIGDILYLLVNWCFFICNLFHLGFLSVLKSPVMLTALASAVSMGA